MAAKPDSARAFIAIDPSPELRLAVAELQRELAALGASVAWTAADNFHVTLRFLGPAVPVALLATIAGGLQEAVASIARFAIELRGTGAFPSLHRPGVLWVGVSDCTAAPNGGGLGQLAAQAEALAQRAGLEPARQPFSAHLTLGRVRGFSPQLRDLRTTLAAADPRLLGRCTIDQVTLYTSILSARQAHYQSYASFALQAG